MYRLAIFLLMMLWAAGAQASDTWGRDCSHTQANAVSAPSRPVTLIGAGEHAGGLPKFACLGWGETGVTSKVLQVRADSVLFTLIDDVDGSSATATVMVRKCPCSTPTIANNTNTCIDILDTALTGTEGAAGTQNAAVRAGPGCYDVITVAGAAGDFPFLLAEAEE